MGRGTIRPLHSLAQENRLRLVPCLTAFRECSSGVPPGGQDARQTAGATLPVTR